MIMSFVTLYVNCKDETFSEKPTSGELQSRDCFFCDAPIVTTSCINKKFNYDNDDDDDKPTTPSLQWIQINPSFPPHPQKSTLTLQQIWLPPFPSQYIDLLTCSRVQKDLVKNAWKCTYTVGTTTPICKKKKGNLGKVKVKILVYCKGKIKSHLDWVCSVSGRFGFQRVSKSQSKQARVGNNTRNSG